MWLERARGSLFRVLGPSEMALVAAAKDHHVWYVDLGSTGGELGPLSSDRRREIGVEFGGA